MNRGAKGIRWVEAVLVASSRHLTRDTLHALTVADFGVRAFKPDRRVLIQLQGDGPQWQPADLRQVIEYARKQRCTWISIDDLAPLNSELPCY